MREAWIIAVIIIAAVCVGGLLFLYGGPAFHPSLGSASGNGKGYTVLAEGDEATTVDQRINYRITSTEEFTALWQMIYSNNGDPQPNIDFSKNEVLAVFDGSHTASGYAVHIDGVTDKDGARMVSITHIAPDASCAPQGDSSSPFIIVEVPKTTLPVTHVESTETAPCY